MRPPPNFWVFNSPSPHPPGADGHHRRRGHVGRHCPYTNNIWCGSVHALLRFRSKTAKMQKFPIDSHSNKKFICLFFRPSGAANPQKGRRHVLAQATPACKIWRESARGLSRNRWRTNKHTYSKTNTSRVIMWDFTDDSGHKNMEYMETKPTYRTVITCTDAEYVLLLLVLLLLLLLLLLLSVLVILIILMIIAILC